MDSFDVFILGAVLNLLFNLTTGLVSRRIAVRITRWGWLYFFLHATYLLISMNWSKSLAMGLRAQFGTHAAASYVVVAILAALVGVGYWAGINKAYEILFKDASEQVTAPASQNSQHQADVEHVPTPAAEDLRLTRIEFGTDSAKPLRRLRIDLTLKHAFSPVQLGHFRVLIDFGEPDDLVPNVWLGLRDNYARSYSDGKNELMFGLTGFVRGIKAEIRDTQHGMRAELVTDHMQMDFDLDKTPYRTIDDFNHKVVHVYVTESLIDKIQTITLLGNSYKLIETDAKQFQSNTPPKIGYDSFPWPLPLTSAELSQPWMYIVLGKPNAPFPREGATMFDFDRNIPKKSLGNVRE